MFKIGDVVKCIDPSHGSFRLTKGKRYVVQTTYKCCSVNWVEVIGDDGDKWSFRSKRFELADPIASMSDEQLADDFRTTHRRNLELSDELTKRGYTITFWRGPNDSKIKIEKEKKEIISL